MKTLYIDTPMGISGDMFLGALIDLGVDVKKILREVRKLPVDNKEISVRTTRELRHIRGSALTDDVKKLSTAIFRTIADAEGRVHGIKPDNVHFHEVGAMDSIIDIVGAAAAVNSLKVKAIRSSPIPLGTGWTDTMHGRLPVPAPATLEILKGVPVAPSTAPFELTTPTGAAIVKTLAGSYGGFPAMTVEKTGYGAGKKDFKAAANVLRAVLGDGLKSGDEVIHVIETNIDDMSPQVAGYLTERLLEAGALDVYITPVLMKKTRPGIIVTALASEDKKEALMEIFFAESTTIGVRSHPAERSCLERKSLKIKTPYGPIRVKVSQKSGRVVNVQPEYEDCRKAALKKKVPITEVMEAAARAASKSG
jgi:uncharacterized protein (TIGR00299 family) protein